MHVINIDKYRPIGAHWIPLYVINNNNLTYFDSFGDENIPKESKKVIGNKNIITNFYRIQPYKSIMCKYVGFIDFMIKKKKCLLVIQIYFLLMIMRRMIK